MHEFFVVKEVTWDKFRSLKFILCLVLNELNHLLCTSNSSMWVVWREFFVVVCLFVCLKQCSGNNNVHCVTLLKKLWNNTDTIIVCFALCFVMFLLKFSLQGLRIYIYIYIYIFFFLLFAVVRFAALNHTAIAHEHLCLPNTIFF
jgi:hypothetical protein